MLAIGSVLQIQWSALVALTLTIYSKRTVFMFFDDAWKARMNEKKGGQARNVESEWTEQVASRAADLHYDPSLKE